MDEKFIIFAPAMVVVRQLADCIGLQNRVRRFEPSERSEGAREANGVRRAIRHRQVF